MLPDKWGNYPSEKNAGVCTCGHDAKFHGATIGTCMAGKCDCLRFVPIPTPTPALEKKIIVIPPKQKKRHRRLDHETAEEYFSCPVCHPHGEE